jgi:hypothetical protein
MAYFIFTKNLDNSDGSIYRIAENQSDLNNLNIIQSDYKIIEDSQENFNAVKFGLKSIVKYNGETIIFNDEISVIKNKSNLTSCIKFFKENIKNYLENNKNHALYKRWNDYYNQLNNLNVDSITHPLNKSLEQYFNDLGQPSFHILQLP